MGKAASCPISPQPVMLHRGFPLGSKILSCFWTMLMFCQPITSGCQHPLTHQPCPPEIYWSIDSSSSCCIHRICCVLCSNVLIVQVINKDTIFLIVNPEGKLLCGWHLDFMLLWYTLNLVVQLICCCYWTWSPPTWIKSHQLDCRLLS